jgi:hypothetical protein
MSGAQLHIVRDRKPVGPAELLAQIVPELAAAEAVVARLRQMMDEQRRALAKERQVAFIRPEHIRREFSR